MAYAEKMIPSAAVREMIDRYRNEARNPAAPDFQISELVPVSEVIRSAPWDHGVYAIYRADQTLIYIGMSMTSVATRIAKHMSRRVQESTFWQMHTGYFAQTILVPNSWEAPSLEEFLVQQALAYPGI